MNVHNRNCIWHPQPGRFGDSFHPEFPLWTEAHQVIVFLLQGSQEVRAWDSTQVLTRCKEVIAEHFFFFQKGTFPFLMEFTQKTDSQFYAGSPTLQSMCCHFILPKFSFPLILKIWVVDIHPERSHHPCWKNMEIFKIKIRDHQIFFLLCSILFQNRRDRQSSDFWMQLGGGNKIGKSQKEHDYLFIMCDKEQMLTKRGEQKLIIRAETFGI